MRDKFFRTQQFVYRHRGTFGYMAGIGVACVAITHAKRKPWVLTAHLEQTTEQVAKMFAENGVLEIISERGSKVILVAADATLTP